MSVVKEVTFNMNHKSLGRILIERNEGLRIPGRCDILSQDTQLRNFWM